MTGYRAARCKDRDGTPVEQGISAAAFAERVVVDRSQIQKIPPDASAWMQPACSPAV